MAGAAFTAREALPAKAKAETWVIAKLSAVPIPKSGGD